jgi:uncharacterized protein (UPF0332 family)
MSSDHDDATQAARKKARRALRSAHVLLSEGDVDGAVNRTYYAAFYLASAALQLAGENPRTHKGTHNRFWQRFVETGRFPEHLGGLLSRAQEHREKADYEPFSRFDAAAASDLLHDVEAFCEAAEALVRDLSEDSSS